MRLLMSEPGSFVESTKTSACGSRSRSIGCVAGWCVAGTAERALWFRFHPIPTALCRVTHCCLGAAENALTGVVSVCRWCGTVLACGPGAQRLACCPRATLRRCQPPQPADARSLGSIPTDPGNTPRRLSVRVESICNPVSVARLPRVALGGSRWGQVVVGSFFEG
jgi:hypothetical protein